MSAQPDPHGELGVPPDATAAEVHRAFRRRLREHHPDARSQQDDATGAASDQTLQRVLAAYETLRAQPASSAARARTERQPHVATPDSARLPPRHQGNPPLSATPVHWVPADPTPGHRAVGGRRSLGVLSPDLLLRWLLGH